MKKRLLKIILFSFMGLLMVVGGFALWLTPSRGPRESINPNENGWTEEIDGLQVLHLKGSPYEIGYQRGHFAKDKILLTADLFEGLLQQMANQTGMPAFVGRLVLDVVWRLCDPHIPERYKREMEGMADASGCDLKTLRRGQILSVLTERGCSAFAIWGRATANGDLLHGRNFDWITSIGLEDTAVLMLYEPQGLQPFASVGYAALVGALTGMNMSGISISMIGAVTDDSSLRGLPLELVLRRILEECEDLEAVEQLMREIKHTVGYNYVIADGDARDARVFETTANHMAIFGPNDPKETVEYAIRIEEAVLRSDEAMDTVIRSLQRCANAPNLPYGSNSYDHRYLGMANRIREHYGTITPEVAMEIVRAVAMRGASLHAALMNSTTREMWFVHAQQGQDAWKQPAVYVDLKTLFLKPDAR